MQLKLIKAVLERINRFMQNTSSVEQSAQPSCVLYNFIVKGGPKTNHDFIKKIGSKI